MTGAGAQERLAVITRSYQAVYNRNPTACETNYWNSFMQGYSTTFRNLVQWHANYGRQTNSRVTGTFTYLDQGDAVGYYWTTVNTYDVVGC